MGPRTPEDCDRLFEEYVNSGNLDALTGLYEPHAVLIPQKGGDNVVGSVAIREALAQIIGLKATLTLNVVKMIPAGDGVAMIYNDWNGHGTAPDGTTFTMAGKAIEIMRRQADGSWRFVIDDPYGRE